jgi:NAD(P)-dependent dehydrogenase (short-subunit alcohol dehydrogenase family)
MMDLILKDQVAIITGASRGIGRAIAETLASEGMRLVLAARSLQQLEEVAQACPVESLVIAMDLRNEEAPGQLIEAAVRRFGSLNLLVNNAGATRRGDFLELSDADWQDGFALKFYSAMRCCRAAWPHLRASQGAIVNIVGIGGRTGSADFAIGGAVNAALLNLTKALADRGSQEGIRVNAVNPGSITTGRLQTRIRTVATEQGLDLIEAARQLAQKQGVPRFGEPAEIARAVAFLASPAAGYCQGTIFDVDGGQTRTL